MLTVSLLLVVGALICAIVSASVGKVPLWVAVILLSIVELLEHIPLR